MTNADLDQLERLLEQYVASEEPMLKQMEQLPMPPLVVDHWRRRVAAAEFLLGHLRGQMRDTMTLGDSSSPDG